MVRAAAWITTTPLSLVRLEGRMEVLGNPNLEAAWTKSLAGAYVPPAMWRLTGKPPGELVAAYRDDNRSAILPQHRHAIDGREYIAGVKGCGAAYDAYGFAPLGGASLRHICHEPRHLPFLEDGGHDGFITGERWFGNTPYGGQAPDNGAIGLMASLRATPNHIAGFHLCPIVALVRLPDAFVEIATRFYWYRRYRGSYWQEVRLMPSNVRLYFHGPVAFGVDTARALDLFGLSSWGDCGPFLENLTRSSFAALTLFARSLRPDPGGDGYRGLDYDDVWLDKDTVVAPDGTLHFADLEGIEDVPAKGPSDVRECIERQFHRNVYEAFYALEALASEAHRRFAVKADAVERRAWILEALERACRLDPFLAVEESRHGTVLVVEPATDRDACSVELELTTREDW